MTKQVQRRRGTATQHTSFTGAEGELSVNTTNKSVHVHDNVTAGGFEAARADMDNVTSSSILTAAGITATTTELNYVDGVTSNIQTQLDGKAGTASPTFTGTLTTANLTATGTTTLAGASTSADITFGDNDKAIFGAGSDLSIYHDGANSYISDQGTGNLKILGTSMNIQSAAGENYIEAVNNAHVKLFYDAAEKLATTSTGIDVTGTVTADGLQVSTSGNLTALLDSTSGTPKLQFRSSSGSLSSHIQHGVGGTANLSFQTNGTTERMSIEANGDISFYEDTGTTAKFFWDASAESLGIGTSSPNSPLEVSNGTENHRVAFGTGEVYLMARNASSYITQEYIANQHVFTGYGDSSANEAMRIDSSGNVGIGTTSPSHLIDGRLSGTSSGEVISVGNVTNGSFGGIAISDGGTYPVRHWGSSLEFYTGNSTYSSATERMRIDSSGNLLVGKTSTLLADTGHNFNPSGFSFHTRSGGAVSYLNRTTSDGDIQVFYKDGTTVGSIGTGSGVMAIAGPSGNGLSFPNNLVLPSTSSAGAKDASTDLGVSYSRFKDLYLSGSIEIENGTGNVGVGKEALNSNTGSNNTAVGYQAGYGTTTGDGNTYLGYVAGQDATTSNSSVYVGAYAGRNITTGSGNTVVGRTALQIGNTCGNTVAIGNDALELATGNGNTAVGSRAGHNITTGQNNTILGRYNGSQGGLDIRTSSNNIVLSDGDGNPRILNNGSETRFGEVAYPVTHTASNRFIVTIPNVWPGTVTSTCGAYTAAYNHYAFRNGNGQVGQITTSGSSTSYGTTSDHRLKENVVELTGATTRLKQLEPKRFNFTADADTTVDGFIAHEVQPVVPEAITGTHNEVDADGNPVYQGIDQSKLVPLLVATIKELEARITALENA